MGSLSISEEFGRRGIAPDHQNMKYRPGEMIVTVTVVEEDREMTGR